MSQTNPPPVQLRIGNEDLATGSGGVYKHLHPVTQQVQAEIPLAGKAEVDQAVAKAAAAFEGWRCTRPEARREILIRLANLIEKHTPEFAQMAALDGGTPLASGTAVAQLSVAWHQYYAGWADKLDGQLISTF